MKNVSLFLFLFLSLLVNSCEPSSECEKCQEAIDHMAGKIGDYSCSPAYMQTAWDRIKTDCGAWGDTYVGYMAEKCFDQNLETPNCEDPKLAIQSPSLAYYTTTGLPGPVEVTVQRSGTSGSENFVFDGQVQSDRFTQEIPELVNEGDEITVTLWKTGTNDVLATASETFTFERNYNWFYLREVKITYMEGSNYSISFEKW